MDFNEKLAKFNHKKVVIISSVLLSFSIFVGFIGIPRLLMSTISKVNFKRRIQWLFCASAVLNFIFTAINQAE